MSELDTVAVMAKLRDNRKARGVDPAAASVRAGHSVKWLEQIESRVLSGRGDITTSTLIAYCRAIGVRVCFQVEEVPRG